MSEEDKNKLPISIVNGLIDTRSKELEDRFNKLLKDAQDAINANNTKTEEAIKKLNDAVSTLDKDFKASTQRKPFSLGFIEFDFEE
jgi:hypothetical protein